MRSAGSVDVRLCKIHILCFVAFTETCCKISWSKQQVGALRPFRAMWRPCPHRCAGAMYSRRLRPCRAMCRILHPPVLYVLFLPFYFVKLFLNSVLAWPHMVPTWRQHDPNMAPTVHNITIWFEHILACRFPHSHLGQVSNVSLEIRVLLFVIGPETWMA